MSGTNSVTTTNGNVTEANALGTGNATINISGGFTLTGLMVNRDDQDGVEATTHRGGNATVNMLDATGVITMKAGNAIFIDSLASGGNITGNIGSGVTVNLDNTIAGANGALDPNWGSTS